MCPDLYRLSLRWQVQSEEGTQGAGGIGAPHDTAPTDPGHIENARPGARTHDRLVGKMVPAGGAAGGKPYLYVNRLSLSAISCQLCEQVFGWREKCVWTRQCLL
jgi:hypothetical protein